MLILSRGIDEVIEVATSDGIIYVKVVEFRAGRVRLGIEAPMSVAVDRSEIAAAKRRNTRTEGT